MWFDILLYKYDWLTSLLYLFIFDKKKKIRMIIINTPDIPNKEVKEVHGIARGSTVRARNVGRDIFASLKNIVGGEISEYTRLQAESREQAIQRMKDDAEILAYGTAVTVD